MRGETQLDILGSIAADVTGAGLAAVVRSAFPAESAVEIAREIGLKVTFGDWFPVTAGECDHSNSTITVNTRAAVDEEFVIAHELGHHLLHRLGRVQEEYFCDEFAYELAGSAIGNFTQVVKD